MDTNYKVESMPMGWNRPRSIWNVDILRMYATSRVQNHSWLVIHLQFLKFRDEC